ncbi:MULTISPECIES: ABC transporter ATP-binding protein [unclassified Halorhodospira]|uniref:ABC transporter ATP-binding protein n=1 Tax=unclassified Halorhodospira TaxID=2626748 RepID=UPI001EE8976B|nr:MULTISPECIES: ABC transporter ATP-binding protein [unclassified Halorhodospira]MCG5540224.1 ABC transporter ATP-binding protein [Halorhodospira sp. M39old]MCG5545075.1 ABC transporter ATP-binding protein [Halorhodospira sp. M38]
MIEVRGVVKHHRGAPLPALDGIDLTVPEGALVGLLGPNGAGKSTLLLTLMGLVERDRGVVEVDGLDLDRYPRAVRARFGLVPQKPAFYPPMTVRENLQLFAALRGIRRSRRGQDIQRVVEVADLSGWMGRRAGTLSGGAQCRLNLAIGLLGRPPILALDEPTAGIDPQSRRFILQAVKEIRDEGTTILFTSHYLEEIASLCTRVAVLDQGRMVASGSIDEVTALQPTVISLRFGVGPGDPRIDEVAEALGGRRVMESGVEIPFRDPGHTLVALGQVLARLELPLCAVRYGSRDLEELFFHLTGRGLHR